MRNILIVFTLMLLAQRIYGSGSDVVNCAGCFAQKWNWASWQCDVHCNVQTSKYGKCSVTQQPNPQYKPRDTLQKKQTFVFC